MHRSLAILILSIATAATLPGCSKQARKPLQLGVGASILPVVLAMESPRAGVPEPVALQTDRYSYLPAKPTVEQINPLLMVIDVRIPRDLLTVEQGANYLLQHSGYHLSGTSGGGGADAVLLSQLITEVHRHLGPMTLQDALITLGGQAYRLLVDPVYRSVAYGLNPEVAQLGGKPE